MVGLQSNAELVAYFIQICVLHAHDKSQQTQNSDCVFIAILTVCFKKCFVYLFERCHKFNCAFVSLYTSWFARESNVILLRAFPLSSRSVFASRMIYDMISKIEAYSQ